MTNDLYKTAFKNIYRFPSTSGQLTVEDLFRLPLTSKVPNKPSLNSVAVNISREIKALGEESFVEASTPGKSILENKLEIVKDIIADRQAENAARANAQKVAEEKQVLLEALKEKEHEDLKGMSKEDIVKRLESLG